MNLTHPIAVILAGGRSVRMGTDKAALYVGQTRLIDRAIARLKSQTPYIYISGQQDYETGLPVIKDRALESLAGPVAGIYAAYKSLQDQQYLLGFLTVPVDAPCLPLDLTRRLVSCDQSQYARGPLLTHPTFAWWRFADLRKVWEMPAINPSPLSLHELVNLTGALAQFWQNEKLFTNLNTYRDVQDYEAGL